MTTELSRRGGAGQVRGLRGHSRPSASRPGLADDAIRRSFDELAVGLQGWFSSLKVEELAYRAELTIMLKAGRAKDITSRSRMAGRGRQGGIAFGSVILPTGGAVAKPS